MRVCIAGAGKVGKAIARELITNGHQVLLIDKDPEIARVGSVVGAHALCADACEVSALEEAQLQTCQVVVCPPQAADSVRAGLPPGASPSSPKAR